MSNICLFLDLPGLDTRIHKQTCVGVGTYRAQKRVSYPQELELQVVVRSLLWVLETKLRSLEEQQVL